MKYSVKKVLLACGLSFALAGTALAASYPVKPIKLIVTFGAGGGTDLVARAIANSTEKILGKPIAVINKVGGSGAVGFSEGANSAPDGYTLTMVTREIVSLPQMGLSPVGPDSFKLVALINEDPSIVLVTPDSKYKKMDDLLNAAKAAPGTVKFASTAKPNFYVLGLSLLTKTSYNQIPFNGAAEAIPALMGNHVEFTMCGPAEAISQLTNKQVRALGVASAKRLSRFPEVPTLTELGVPLITGTWRGIAVPLKTPDDVVKTLADAFGKAAQDPAFVKFMNDKTFGINFLGPRDFTDYTKKDYTAMTEIVKAVKAQQSK